MDKTTSGANPDNEKRQRLYRAHREQMGEVYLVVQRELIRAGLLSGPPRAAWTLGDAYPLPKCIQPEGTVIHRSSLLGEVLEPGAPLEPGSLTTHTDEPPAPNSAPTAALELRGRTAAVIGAALVVEESFQRAHGMWGEAIARCRAHAEHMADLDEWATQAGPHLATLMQNTGLADRLKNYGRDVAAVDVASERAILEYLVSDAPQRAAAASALASELERQQDAALAAYADERRGPRSHFLFELHDAGLDTVAISELFNELPKPDRFEHRIYFEEEEEKALDRVAKRVERAGRHLQSERKTREDRPRVPLDRLGVVLCSAYVERGQPISLHFRSGPGVSSSGS